MEASLKAMRKLTRESDHIVLISGLGVARAAGLNGVRAEHIAYDIEQKYGYSNDEIISSMFLSKRVEIFYQYYKEIILNCALQPTSIHEGALRLQQAGKLDAIVKRTVYPLYEMAGCDDVIELHGSVEKNYCPNCGKVYGSDFIRHAVGIPSCTKCGVPLRPGFTLLGEMVDNGKISAAANAVENADLLLIVGTSIRSPLCLNLTKYYKGDKMLLLNTHEMVGDDRANYRAYGDLCELFKYVADIPLPQNKKKKQKDKIQEAEQTGVYLDYAKQLVEKGEAYYCFCTKERLEELRASSKTEDGKEIAKYDKHCLHLSKEEVQAKLDAGIPYVIRQNNPTEGTTTFHDAIYGDIEVDNAELDDMILIKTDGYPTYNFANVVDDHLQEITHVVRGNEYLSSAPKYNRLYEAFGWEVPEYVHCPTITDENHKKLSKRCGHSSVEDLLDQGFLPEAIINFVALLGWSPTEDREIFSLKELEEVFDYHHISKSPAVFDIVKLRWMNGEYIKAMDMDAYMEHALPVVKEVVTKDYDLKKVAELLKTRIEVFPDIKEKIDFFEELPEYDVAMYTHKKMKTNTENSLEVLQDMLPRLEAMTDFSIDEIEEVCKAYIAEKELKNGRVLWPLRTAVSGKQMTPGGAYEIMEILGKEESLASIRKGIEMLSEAADEE